MTSIALSTSNLQHNWKQQIWLIFIGLLGAIWLWFTTSQHGIGISPDSADYLAVAEHLLKSKGFVSYSGEPLIVRPPLYSLAIAALSFLLSLDLETSALLLNLIFFFSTTYVSGKLAFLITESLSVSLLTCFSFIFGIPIVHISVYAWSELFFLFLINLALIHVVKFNIYKSKRHLIISSALVGCSSVTRYAGIFITASLLIYLALNEKENFLRRKNNVYIFLIMAFFPLYLWVIRNYLLARSLFGYPIKVSYSINEYALIFFETVTNWFILPMGYLRNKDFLFLSGTILVLTFSLIAISQIKETKVLILIIFTYTYLSILLITRIITYLDPLSNRLLSPIFIPVTIILLNFFYHRFYLQLRSHVSKKTYLLLVILGMVAWFTYPLASTIKLGLEVHKEGLGYQSVQWKTNETLAYVRQAREELLQLPVYTNDPEGLYFLTRIRAGRLSIQSNPNWPETGSAYLICLKQGYLGDCLEILKRLRQNPDIKPVAQFSDGTIYLVTRRKT